MLSEAHCNEALAKTAAKTEEPRAEIRSVFEDRHSGSQVRGTEEDTSKLQRKLATIARI